MLESGGTETAEVPIDELRMVDRELWLDGPPHEEFARLRAQCPVHWTDKMTDYPDEKGF